MTRRRDFLKTAGAVGSIGALTGCLGIGGSQPFNDGEIDMNISPSVPTEDLQPQYGPIREYISNEFDRTTKMNIANNYASVIEALGSGTTDIAETGPFAAALGVNEGDAEVILQRKGYGTWTYKSIIAVPNDSDIEEVSDLEGKSVAFSDPLSTSGALYPLYNISQAGVNIGNLPEGNGSQAAFDAVFAGGHVSSYEQLADGQVDAAGMGGFVRDTSTGPTPDEFESTARTLQESTGLPRAPIVVSPELSDDRKDALQQAFIDAPDSIYYGQDGEEGTDDDLWFNDVREAGVDKYQSVIDVATELGVGAEIFESGDDS
ncbi:phosphate/phosphite/phosphonate ABC transporter substrate-binding protein [Natronomonas marina]|jgi:phosphonate transport system substrate-binding protein|uniref:phosphate/phosphite/phosphonate ABC transporter substrate-binding protein n=1 Tax=Natronomonas marina TaxID=2961939 RepID=UPI0020C97F7C|nr:phosphate/phosphite/phosphonate ABC transporter substrate-binding protein [Natronomonas marina]